jgi:acyl carrier protein
MERTEIEAKTKEIISSYLEIEVSNLSDLSSLKDLGMSSLDQSKLMIELENEFNLNTINILNEDSFMNIGMLCDNLEILISSRESNFPFFLFY